MKKCLSVFLVAVLTIAALGMAALFVYLGVDGFLTRHHTQRLLSEGKEVEGKITASSSGRAYNPQTADFSRYGSHVSYVYQVSGIEYTGEVSEQSIVKLPNRYQPGGPISITYLPSDPSIRYIGVLDPPQWVGFVIVCCVVLAPLSIFWLALAFQGIKGAVYRIRQTN